MNPHSPAPASGWLTAGLDEVGRGCLAGPVIAAAVILNPAAMPAGLADSKALSPPQRERLAVDIRQHALAWAIGRAEPSEIDRINILQASLLAMQRAFARLPIRPEWAQVDGNRYPAIDCPGETVIGGDALIPAISAASILAKVFRDAEMQRLDVLYPGYGFARHKGYPTPLHRARLKELGLTPLHRRSFAPVAKLCQDSPSMDIFQ